MDYSGTDFKFSKNRSRATFKSQDKIFFINSICPFSLILRPEKSILRHEKVSLVALFTTTIIFYIPFLSIF